MHQRHHVVVGRDWGSLPLALQSRWTALRCDSLVQAFLEQRREHVSLSPRGKVLSDAFKRINVHSGGSVKQPFRPAPHRPTPSSRSPPRNPPSHMPSSRASSSTSEHGSRVLVVSHYNEDLSWLEKLPASLPWLVYSHADGAGAAASSSHEPEDGNLTTIANLGREASAYLAFIVQHYDEMPDAMAFVMAKRVAYHNANLLPSHAPAWRNNGDLLALLPRLRWPDADAGAAPGVATAAPGYVPLNYQNYRCESLSQWAHSSKSMCGGRCANKTGDANFNASAVWGELMAPYGLGPQLRDVCYYCCSQFAVSRAAVRARPRALYEGLLALALSDGAKHAAWLLEFTWHVIFGRPARLPRVAGCAVVERLPCPPRAPPPPPPPNGLGTRCKLYAWDENRGAVERPYDACT